MSEELREFLASDDTEAYYHDDMYLKVDGDLVICMDDSSVVVKRPLDGSTIPDNEVVVNIAYPLVEIYVGGVYFHELDDKDIKYLFEAVKRKSGGVCIGDNYVIEITMTDHLTLEYLDMEFQLSDRLLDSKLYEIILDACTKKDVVCFVYRDEPTYLDCDTLIGACSMLKSQRNKSARS